MLRESKSLSLDRAYFSVPEEVCFPTSEGEVAYGYFYPPANKDFTAPGGGNTFMANITLVYVRNKEDLNIRNNKLSYLNIKHLLWIQSILFLCTYYLGERGEYRFHFVSMSIVKIYPKKKNVCILEKNAIFLQ